MNASSTPTSATLRPPSRARAAAAAPRQRWSPLRRRTLGATIALAVAVVGVGVGIVAGEPATALAAPRVQTMSGRVVDAKSLRPLSGLQVVVRSVPTGREWVAVTDARGQFRANGVLLDEFEVYVRPSLGYCGGYVWDDFFDVYPALDARLSNIDWNSWSADYLGTIGAFARVAGRAC